MFKGAVAKSTFLAFFENFMGLNKTYEFSIFANLSI